MADAPRDAFTIWFTGLSGSGKTTIASLLAEALRGRGMATVVLDGDEIRRHITRELGFDRFGRDEQVARVGWLCAHLNAAGVVAVAALISPYRVARERLRERIPRFLEVHVDAPLEALRARDPKGLYRSVDEGSMSGLTGIDEPYEPPLEPDLRYVSDGSETPDAAVARITDHLVRLGYLTPAPGGPPFASHS